MNKKELICAAAHKANLSQNVTAQAFAAIISTINETLVKGERIQILGFGSFSVKEHPARKGFNPLTLKPIKIKAKKVVKFNPSESIKIK